MVDRDTSQVVDIVAFRDTKDVTEWLKGYPDIEVVSRDGSISYAKAIEEAFPQAIQVSNRFHLVKNLTEEAKEYIKRTLPRKIKMSGMTEFPEENCLEPKNKCTRLEMLQMQREKEKNKKVQKVKKLFFKRGYSSRKIAIELGLSPRTVLKYIKYEGKMIHGSKGASKRSNLDPYKDTIIAMNLDRGTTMEIFRTICKEGYRGSYSNLKTFLAKHNKESGRRNRNPPTTPILERRHLITLLYKDISKLKESEQKKVRIYIEGNGDLQKVYSAIKEFRRILAQKDTNNLEKWIETTKTYSIPELNHFVHGIERDLPAVKNAARLDDNNGLIEGIINKIKVIKRVMYGRCSFELLRLKVLML
ncbi:hypothetical protein DU53_09685 [Kosmotoga sp. DU53]|jgi:transposase|uniref:Transposase IS204/IS1001/IS1096/IS1165 family protein n=2 Tax=Kosmotogaceae TaxID=1643948 RepID=C5CFY9_KOSOT|nr:transposase IS204/IS1001/IS1096/IS1165 family protein [Kosmotoga olearia TBF 19.5.1]MDI3524649.1 hypothetical protein [Kosmotoga sp.]MDK2954449.1 hypothetical protein [Kosmotoga sp.]OAA19743.1 hypothetical protein DU53_09685 [Kosmotoga sp. DU53]